MNCQFTIIAIKNNKAVKYQRNVMSNEPFQSVFATIVPVEDLLEKRAIFCLDGSRIDPSSTPEQVGLENGSLVDLFVV